MKKNKLLASSNTLDGIKGLIREYFYTDKEITIESNGTVVKDGIVMRDYKVDHSKNRYKFRYIYKESNNE